MSRSHLAHLILGLLIGILPTLYKLMTAKLEKLNGVIDPVEKALLDQAEKSLESELKKEEDQIT